MSHKRILLVLFRKTYKVQIRIAGMLQQALRVIQLGCRQGKELLGQLERIYVDGKLFQDSDRDTVYCVAQRDLIMELKYNSKGEL